MDRKMLHVISVGRLVWEKGYERLIRIHSSLIEEGIFHTLTIIGGGILQNRLEEVIRELKVEESCKLLGVVDNPQPYIAQADLFVCSSITEGLSGVVAESMYQHKPIVATKCMGPTELLQNGKYGLLVENTDEGLYEGLKKMLQDEALRKFYSERLKKVKVFPFDDQIVKRELEKLFVPRRSEGKIKILFIMMNMLLGGAEKVLAHLLEIMDYSRYDIELVLLTNSKHPSIHLDERAQIRCVYETEQDFWNSYSGENLELNLDDYYDYVVGFLGIIGPLLFKKMNKMKAINNAVKINWVHGEFSEVVYGREKAEVLELYQNIEYIVCVSESLKQQVMQYMGNEYEPRLKVISNAYNYVYVQYRSRELCDINLNDLYHIEFVSQVEWKKKSKNILECIKGYKKVIFLVGDFASSPENKYLNWVVEKMSNSQQIMIKATIPHPKEIKSKYLKGYLYNDMKEMWANIGNSISIGVNLDEDDCIVACGDFLTVWLSGHINTKAKKIVWIHENSMIIHKWHDKEVIRNAYRMMDKIVCDSENERYNYIDLVGNMDSEDRGGQ